jgi:phosphoglycerol transferase MdoB-like AlkP superfamily enzyme
MKTRASRPYLDYGAPLDIAMSVLFVVLIALPIYTSVPRRWVFAAFLVWLVVCQAMWLPRLRPEDFDVEEDDDDR